MKLVNDALVNVNVLKIDSSTFVMVACPLSALSQAVSSGNFD